MKALALIACFLLTGCATGTGAHWYAPGTWFSHAPATKVDAANAREDKAREEALHIAQKSAHETALALGAAGNSRPVTVAVDANSLAVGLLDQALGALAASELAQVRTTVAGLLSEDPAIRADAERRRSSDLGEAARISAELKNAQSALDAAEHKLRAAFDRENALANELRTQRALMWIATGVAILGLAGWVYVRFFLGGIPGAVGHAMVSLERTHPDLVGTPEQPGPVRLAFDQILNRHEQSVIRSEYLKVR